MEPNNNISGRRFTMYVVGRNFEDALAKTTRAVSNQEDAVRLLDLRQSMVGEDVALDIFGFDVYADSNTNHWRA